MSTSWRLMPPATVKRRRCFLQLQRYGQRCGGSCLRVLSASGHQGLRVGYTVSRRVGNAVVRNRLRRRLKEIVRLAPTCLLDQIDYVVIALPQAAAQSFCALRGELICLLERIARRRRGLLAAACSSSSQPTR